MSSTRHSRPVRRPLSRLATFAHRRRRLMFAAWAIAFVAVLLAAGRLGGEFRADYATPGSESKAAADRLAERFPTATPNHINVVWTAPQAGGPTAGARVDAFLSEAQRLEGIGDGVTAADAQLSPDGRVGMTRLAVTERNPQDVPVATSERLIALAQSASTEGLRLELGSLLIARAEASEVSSESIGFVIAGIVLLLTFGSVVAAGMPLGTALFGLGVSSGLGAILASALDVPDWGSSVAAMMGIGVGIDYALLIVTRFRAALAAGADVEEGVVEAVTTAGRSVLVAGTTVVIALLGLFLVGLTYLYGVALSAIIAVLVVMAASVTLLPALLSLAGARVNRWRIPGTGRSQAPVERTRAARWSRLVQRRPRTVAAIGLLTLLALAAPVTQMRLNYPDAGNDRAGTTTRAAYDLIADGFGKGASAPLLVVVDGPDGDQLERLTGELAAGPGVASVAPAQRNETGDTAVIAVTPATAPQDEATEQLLARLRDEVIPSSGAHAYVGGTTAAYVDQSRRIAERLPVFIGGVVLLSFLLLLASFRAPVVALKAGIMNLLSIAAAYGVVAAVADGGAIGGLVGIESATPVPPFLPVMMFAILFGLSMDYEVFLLSRIREAFVGRAQAGEAVVDGVARTAKVITAAAAIMVAVFGAFVLSSDLNLKLVGVGLASAILIDATIVRMLLVPAIMELLGARSWWMPHWLDRVVPQLEVEPEPARA